MKTSIVHEEAQAELDAAIAYYEAEQIGLGLRFHSDIQRAIEIIERHPQIGTRYKSTQLRRFIVGHFPYLIFYLEMKEVVWIVAIAHSKRKPDYWETRKIQKH